MRGGAEVHKHLSAAGVHTASRSHCCVHKHGCSEKRSHWRLTHGSYMLISAAHTQVITQSQPSNSDIMSAADVEVGSKVACRPLQGVAYRSSACQT